MRIQLEAIYENGVFRPLQSVDLPEHQLVTVTIEQATSPPMTQDEWGHFILSTAGSISDPTFLRHEQGEYEQREQLP